MAVDFRAVYHRYPPHVSLLQDARRTAMAQVADADLHTTLDSESNSVALVVKHLAGTSVALAGLPDDRRREAGSEARRRVRDAAGDLTRDGRRRLGCRLWPAGDGARAGDAGGSAARGRHPRRAPDRRAGAEPCARASRLSRRPGGVSRKALRRPNWTSLTIPKGRQARSGWGPRRRSEDLRI